MIKLINLCCGQRYHQNWVNVDFVSTTEFVQAHDLTKGIPFPDQEFDVAYHSHVLEHFEKSAGLVFMQECFRVLKKGGILRVAIPDLEGIVRCYIEQLNKSLEGDEQAQLNYEWIMLELYDQTVRNYSGGTMAEYLRKDELHNENFIYTRIGQEGKQLRNILLRERKQPIKEIVSTNKHSKQTLFSKFLSGTAYRNKLKQILFFKELQHFKDQQEKLDIGTFRKGGEIHLWMYDRYSLAKVFRECGFVNIQVTSAFESRIPHWNSYGLESKDGEVFKPDSLFMEANKPV